MVYSKCLCSSAFCWSLTFVISSPEPKAHWWAYSIGRCPSSSVVVSRPHPLNIFSPETASTIKVKFHMVPPCDGGIKVCLNGLGHMTKMSAVPIYGKTLKSPSPEPKGRWPWKLVCSIRCSHTTKFVQTMILNWPWYILRQGQTC